MNWKFTATAMGLALLASTGIAGAEGVLNIYNWGNYTSPDMIKKFEAANNVKVTITDYDSNDTALAKIRQGGHGFDVVVPSQNYIPIWIQEGLLLETRPDQMENFKNVAEEWKNPDFDPGRHYTVPWAMGTVGVVVNTDVYKGDINTWGIIFNTPDELKGKVNVVPEMTDVIDAAVLYNGGTKCTGDKEILKKVRDTLVDGQTQLGGDGIRHHREDGLGRLRRVKRLERLCTAPATEESGHPLRLSQGRLRQLERQRRRPQGRQER